MRILTVVRQVLDAEESVRLRDDKVDTASSKLVVDTMDEYGVEEALRLRERGLDAEIVVLAVGAPRCEDALRSALALGADRAILVETEGAYDVIAVSRVVAAVARREQVDMVITGGQQADWDSQALGAATAERLGWPQATWTTRLAVEGTQVTVTHDVDDGMETFSASLPIVITTQQGLNEPRYPTLPNIMKAKRKELTREPIAAFGVVAAVKLLRAEIQIKPRRHTIIDGKDAAVAAEHLVNLLSNEAKVLA